MSIFRKEYRQLSDHEKQLLNDIKTKAEELLAFYEGPGPATKDYGRSMALARTKLEESVMWAVKGITG